MKKVLKIFMLIAILFAFTVNISVFAEPADELEELNDISLAAADTDSANTTSAQTNSDNKSSTQVTSVAAIDESKLSISDILNILLIATGIVIIMLAIAIFIKLK